jgi:hypothetical protein
MNVTGADPGSDDHHQAVVKAMCATQPALSKGGGIPIELDGTSCPKGALGQSGEGQSVPAAQRFRSPPENSSVDDRRHRDPAASQAKLARRFSGRVQDLPDRVLRRPGRCGDRHLVQGPAATGDDRVSRLGAADVDGEEGLNLPRSHHTVAPSPRHDYFASLGRASKYMLIREQAVVQPLGSPELKGKSQAVEVSELLGLRDGGGGAPA